jgi:hypothetical protein
VLYWYRSPPGVRVGREPFDAALRVHLEAQYPDIRFDWDQLAADAVVPALEIEPWRERRRAQRDARRSRAEPADDEGLADAEAETEAERPDAQVAVTDGPADPAGDAAVVGSQPPRSEARRRRRSRRRRRPDGAGTPGTPAPEAPREDLPDAPVAPDPADRTTPSSES